MGGKWGAWHARRSSSAASTEQVADLAEALGVDEAETHLGRDDELAGSFTRRVEAAALRQVVLRFAVRLPSVVRGLHLSLGMYCGESQRRALWARSRRFLDGGGKVAGGATAAADARPVIRVAMLTEATIAATAVARTAAATVAAETDGVVAASIARAQRQCCPQDGWIRPPSALRICKWGSEHLRLGGISL